jgi:UDPglucose 6-dehydrogenase
MRIAMIGTGYVGLVSGACFSAFGHHVVCVDKDRNKIDSLNAGRMPIYEPGLAEVVADNVKAGRLSFTDDLKTSVKGADAVFIAVGTPSRRGDGHADLTYVFKAAEEIASAIDGYTVIVTKSTVPVGTGKQVEEIVRRIRPAADFDVASRTSAAPTALSAAPSANARAKSYANSTGRCSSTKRRCCSPAAKPRS